MEDNIHCMNGSLYCIKVRYERVFGKILRYRDSFENVELRLGFFEVRITNSQT